MLLFTYQATLIFLSIFTVGAIGHGLLLRYKWYSKHFFDWTPDLVAFTWAIRHNVPVEDYPVQPRSSHLSALPIFGALPIEKHFGVQKTKRYTPSEEGAHIANRDCELMYVDDSSNDWMDVGMVSLRDENGNLIGSSADVLKELKEARDAGGSISVEEAQRRAIERILKGHSEAMQRRELERVAEKVFGGPDPVIPVVRESTKDSGPV